MKVVWICHFSNPEIRKQLPLSKMKLKKGIALLKKSKVNYEYVDFAPWITMLINEFKSFKDVDLHIISPHKGLKQKTVYIEHDGVSYCFFRSDNVLLHTSNEAKNRNNDFRSNRKKISAFVKDINPDIVNVIGAENPYYSISALDITDKPLYISCQTVYSNPMRESLGDKVDRYRWDLEKKIHAKALYFGCAGRMHHDLVLKNNPNAIIFKMFFPTKKPKVNNKQNKEFDFVFFAARVSAKKGIEDALCALAVVKKNYSEVSLRIVGKCSEVYKQHLLQLCESLNIEENIFFKSYFPVHSEMHEYVSKGRFALLPIKLDVISSTLIEAIYLNLPIITYQTSGTPFLNKNGEAVLLSPIGNIEALADNMLKLMKSDTLGGCLIKKAQILVDEEFDNTKSSMRLLLNYKAVIEHFHKGTPIPKKLLFDINEFPLYQ